MKFRFSGNVKNHVKVGGWSQQRYERRRDKQLQHYAKDIADELMELDRENAFRRVLMVGSKGTIRAIRSALPNQIARKAVEDEALDLGKSDDWVQKEIFDLFCRAGARIRASPVGGDQERASKERPRGGRD